MRDAGQHHTIKNTSDDDGDDDDDKGDAHDHDDEDGDHDASHKTTPSIISFKVLVILIGVCFIRCFLNAVSKIPKSTGELLSMQELVLQ